MSAKPATTRWRPIAAAALAAVMLTSHAEEPQDASPAAALYGELQQLRHPHDEAIHGPLPVRREALERALVDLDAGLATTRSNRYVDLSFGSPWLASRRLNLLLDKARALYRLGDETGALGAWREALDVGWVPAELLTHGEPEMAAWLARSAPPELTARSRLATTLSSPNASTPTPRGPLTLEERIEGVSTVWSTARQFFVWFDHVPALDWDRAYRGPCPARWRRPTTPPIGAS